MKLTLQDVPADLFKSVDHEKFMVTAMTQPGKVKKIGCGRFGARKVMFENGVQATLKPKLFSNEIFRGIPRDTQYLREAAAYQLDWKILHWNLVPPTTLTMYLGEPSSIQAWVTGFYAKEIVPQPFNHDSDGWKTRLALFSSKINADDLRKIVLFDLIINNTDRHAKNCLFDTFSDRVWAIDHGLAFGRYYTKYFNVFHREIFRKNLTLDKTERELLSSITQDQLTETLHRYLKSKEIADTYWRIQWMLAQENLGFIHVSNGNDDKDSFPTYEEWFKRHPPRENKVLALVSSMSNMDTSSA